MFFIKSLALGLFVLMPIANVKAAAATPTAADCLTCLENNSCEGCSDKCDALGDLTDEDDTVTKIKKALKKDKDVSVDAEKEACKQIQEDLREAENVDEETCKDLVETSKNSFNDFSKACNQFSSGQDLCISELIDCAKCPDKQNYRDEDGLNNCVQVQAKQICPLYSGKTLKAIKKKRDELNTDIKTLKTDLESKEEKLVKAKNKASSEMQKEKQKFTKAHNIMQRTKEDAEANYKITFANQKQKINQKLVIEQEKIQKQLDADLKMRHNFENKRWAINQSYKTKHRGLIQKCSARANVKLEKYRLSRKQAIQTNQLKMSVSSLLSKKRMSFAKKDSLLFKNYSKKCLSQIRGEFQDLKAVHLRQLRQAEQIEKQYLEKLKITKNKFSKLAGQAYKDNNQALQTYSNRMKKALGRYNIDYARLLKLAQSKGANSFKTNTKTILNLQKQVDLKKTELKDKDVKRVSEAQLINYLKNKKAPEDDSIESKAREATSALQTLHRDIQYAKEQCKCDDDLEINGNCKILKTYSQDSRETKYKEAIAPAADDGSK